MVERFPVFGAMQVAVDNANALVGRLKLADPEESTSKLVDALWKLGPRLEPACSATIMPIRREITMKHEDLTRQGNPSPEPVRQREHEAA